MGSHSGIVLIRQAGIFMSIPMVLVGGPTLGFFIGRLIDSRLSTDPWGVLVAVGVGLVAGVFESIKLIRYVQRTLDGGK